MTGDSLVLTDFGMSKGPQNAGKVTGNTIGTPAWTPPEIHLGTAKWTIKSDIFSLGMVFYEIVSRKNPFADLSSNEIVDKLIRGERPDIPSSCPQVIYA